MSFFGGFVGEIHQLLLWGAFFVGFSEYLADGFVTHVKIFGEGEVQFHGGHGAVHVRCCLSNALIAFLGGLSHDAVIWMFWFDLVSLTVREWCENGAITDRER